MQPAPRILDGELPTDGRALFVACGLPGGDFAATEGGRPGPAIRLAHRYLDRVLLAAADDPTVQRTFLEVMHLLRPPATLLRPDIAARVLMGRGRFAPLPDLYLSDHVPFWRAGLPAVMLTDTAYLRNPYYHLPSDRPETLDPAFWWRVVAATLTAVAALAQPA